MTEWIAVLARERGIVSVLSECADARARVDATVNVSVSKDASLLPVC